MIDSILKILELWLWENSKTLWFILWIVDSIGSENLKIIEVVIAMIIWGIFLLWIWFFKFNRIRGTREYKHIQSYVDYVWFMGTSMLFKFLIWTALIFLVITQWLLINEFWSFIMWFWWDGKYHSWLAILYWYDKESAMYWYYNLARWGVLIVILLTTFYNWIMYYNVWEVISWDGKTSKFYEKTKIWIIAIIIIVLLLFSVIPDLIINKFLNMFWTDTSTMFWQNDL